MNCSLCGFSAPTGRMSCPCCYAVLPLSSSDGLQPGELLTAGLRHSSHTILSSVRQSFLKRQLSQWESQVKSKLNRIIVTCQRDSTSLESQCRLAVAYYLADDRVKALAAAEQAVSKGAADATLLHNRAVIHAAQGQRPQALDGFQQARALGADASITTINIALLTAQDGMLQDLVELRQSAWECACKNTDLLNTLAAYLAQMGHVAEATTHLQECLTPSSDNPDLHVNLGVICFHQGDMKSAVQHFITACELETAPEWGHYNAGICNAVIGDLNKANRFFSVILRKNEKCGPAQGQLAVLHERAKQPKRAIEEFRDAVRNAPRDFEIRYNLALFWMHEGKPEDALTEAERAIELYPNDHDALLVLIAAGYHAKRYRLAVEHGARGLQLFPNSAPLHYNYALLLDAQERFDEALEQLTWLTTRYPKYIAALNNMGVAQMLKTKSVEAVDFLTRAIDLAPEDLRVRSNLALAYYLQGDTKLAMREIGLGGRSLAETPAILDIIGHINADQKRNLEAIKASVTFWGKLASKEPTNIETQTNLGIAFYRDDQPDVAVDHFKKVLLLLPRSLTAHNNLGLAYAKNKLLTEAMQHLTRVVEAQPNNPVVHSNLGLVKYFKGDTEEALGHWREVTRLAPDYAKRREATKFSAYDDSEMILFPINTRRRAISLPPELPPFHHEPRFAVRPPSFLPLLPWEDLAEVQELKEKAKALRRKLM